MINIWVCFAFIWIEVVWDWIRDSYTETLLYLEGVTEVIYLQWTPDRSYHSKVHVCLLVHLEEWPHIVSEFNLLLCNMDTCLCGQLTLFFLVQSLSFDRKFGFAKYIVHIHMKMFVLLCFTSLEANNFLYASVWMFTAQIRPKPQSLSDINKCRILIFMIIDNKYQYTL